MGNQLTSCCGADGEDRNELKTENAPLGYKKRSAAGAKTAVDEHFKRELECGVQVRITLGDCSRLLCDLHYAENEESLYVACDINGERRVRRLPKSSISGILYKQDDIASLESAAGIRPAQDHCVALCLDEEGGGGGCLPLFFDDQNTKQRFINFYYQSMQ